MNLDVVTLTQELIAMPSVSHDSNVAINETIAELLAKTGFEIERHFYDDENGVRKSSLVAKKGNGDGGFGLFSHSDTVPGIAGEWEPFAPTIENGRLIGRGACDMKGPLAATIVAGAQVDADTLTNPLYIVVTADEEQGYGGALQVGKESRMFQENPPKTGIVAEPTDLRPVYAHKGGVRLTVTAKGRAAHTSTGKGISANFKIAPFMAEMAELVNVFQSDKRFMNDEFDPPTNGFNMIIDDGGCKSNVTAEKSVCTLALRTMPNDHREEAVAMIVERANKYGFPVDTYSVEPFYVSPEAEIVRVACDTLGISYAETVPFGTEAAVFQQFAELVILGPGHIDQAHTVGEWIDIAQLRQSVTVYQQMIAYFCMS